MICGVITAWGPYGWAGSTCYICYQNGPWTGVSRGAAGYNAWTGNEWATSYGRAYNSTTGTRVVCQRGSGREGTARFHPRVPPRGPAATQRRACLSAKML